MSGPFRAPRQGRRHAGPIAAVGLVFCAVWCLVVLLISLHAGSEDSGSLPGQFVARFPGLALTGPAPYMQPPAPELSAPDMVPETDSALRHFPYQSDTQYRLYSLGEQDTSPRCMHTGICDGDHSCGPDGLGCITDNAQRRQRIREAAQWTWLGYKRLAWGADEADPVGGRPRQWFGLGLTIVDGMDTLLILGLHEEYWEARQWVANHLSLSQRSVSVFESTIRILGGLLSAFYHSGGDELLLRKALDFANRVMPAFETSSGIAIGTWTLTADAAAVPPPPPPPSPQVWTAWQREQLQKLQAQSGGARPAGTTNLAEAGTLSLELSTLSRTIGNDSYREAGMLWWYALLQMPDADGLYCTSFSADTMQCQGYHFTMGGAADSMYEYMLKQWLLTAGKDELCASFYRRAMHGLRKHMVTRVHMPGTRTPQWIVADVEGGEVAAGPRKGEVMVLQKTLRVEHLTCFVPGMLALGHMYGVRTTAAAHGSDPPATEPDDLLLAVRLVRACYEMYSRSPSGIAYDSVTYRPQVSPSPPASPIPPQTSQQGTSTTTLLAAPASNEGRRLQSSQSKTARAIPQLSRHWSSSSIDSGGSSSSRSSRSGMSPHTAVGGDGTAAGTSVPAASWHVILAAGRHAWQVKGSGHSLPTTWQGVQQEASDTQAIDRPAERPAASHAWSAALHRQVMQGFFVQVRAGLVWLGQTLRVQAAALRNARRAVMQRVVANRHTSMQASTDERMQPARMVQASAPNAAGGSALRQDSYESQLQPRTARSLLAADPDTRAAEVVTWAKPRRDSSTDEVQAAGGRKLGEGQRKRRGGHGIRASFDPDTRKAQPRVGIEGSLHAAAGNAGALMEPGGRPTMARASPTLAMDRSASTGDESGTAQVRGTKALTPCELHEAVILQRLHVAGGEARNEDAPTPEAGTARSSGLGAASQTSTGTRSAGQQAGAGRLVDEGEGQRSGRPDQAGAEEVKASVAAVIEAAAARGIPLLITTSHNRDTGAARAEVTVPLTDNQPSSMFQGGASPPPDYNNQVYDVQPVSKQNFLRPEVVESLFYLYRATGDPIYQEWGWNIFRAIERFAKLPTGGYTSMMDVDTVPPVPADKMESFWLAETLKYLFLLFSDPDVIPLDQYVFNTEAHPLPRWGSTADYQVREALRFAQARRRQAYTT